MTNLNARKEDEERIKDRRSSERMEGYKVVKGRNEVRKDRRKKGEEERRKGRKMDTEGGKDGSSKGRNEMKD